MKSERGVDGFVPGEAASVVLLESERRARARSATILARVEGLGRGREPNTRATERASTGAGLCAALEAALRPLGPAQGLWVLCDLNGESDRAFEWGLAQARLGPLLAGSRAVDHPAHSLGDVGAASGGVLLACAATGFARGYAPAEHALLWTRSDDGGCSAALLDSARTSQ